MKEKYSIYALITVTCWAFSNVLTGIVMQEISTFELAFLRYFIAVSVLLVIVCWKKLSLPAKKDIPWFFLSGGLGFFLYTVCFNLGCAKTTSAVSSTIIAAVSLFTAILSGILLQEKIMRVQWNGIILAFTGVLILVFEPGKMEITSGTLWLLGAAVILSFYNLVQRKLTQRYTALQVSVYSIFCGFLFLCIFAPKGWRVIGVLSTVSWVCIGVMGIFSSAVAYVCWAKALSLAPQTSSVSNFMFLTPFIATVLGYWILGETLSFQNGIGGVLILAGLLLFRWKK